MSIRKKRLIIIVIGIIGGFALIWFNPLNVQASIFGDNSEEIASFLQNHSDWLQTSSVLTVAWREILWWVIKKAYWIVSILEGLIPESLNLLDFLDDSGMQGIVSAVLNDLVVVLMVLVLVYLGLKTVIAKNPPNFKSVGVNIFISAFLILGMPTLMNTMQDISVTFYDATQTGENNEQVSSLSWGLIQDNTADLLYVANQGFDLIENDSESTNPKNALTPGIFESANMNEVITANTIDESDNSEQLENFRYELSYDEQGNARAVEIDNSVLSALGDVFDKGYFRYPAKFLPIVVGLIALAVAYILTVVVLITTIVEIGFKRVVGLFVFATDLETGQRTKIVVQDIGNAFMLIAFTGLSLKMYTLFLTFLSTSNVNHFIYLIAIVSATFVLIKGSNTIMRYFGVDVGLKEGFGQMAGTFTLARGLKNLGKNLNNKGEKPNSKGNNSSEETNSSNSNDNLNNNLNNDGRLKKSVNSAGKAFGYARNRGIGGMAEDAVKGTGEAIANKGRSVKDGVKSVADSAKTGYQDGVTTGENNRDKWNNRKTGNQSVNDTNTQETSNKSNDSGTNEFNNDVVDESSGTKNSNPSGKETSINDQEVDQKPTMGSYRQENGVQGQSGDSNKTSDTLQNQSATTQNNEEILRQIELDNAMDPKNMDTTGKVKMKADMDSSGETKQTVSESTSGNINMNPSRAGGNIDQKVNTINGQESSSLPNATQKVDQVQSNVNTTTSQKSQQSVEQTISQKGLQNEVQSSVQKVVQQVENTSFADPEKAKQSIIKEVQKGSFGSNDVKQRVVQEIEKSNIATPQQLEQNVQQVFSKAGVSNEVQDSVQKVIQEVQSNSSYQPESVKAKIVEEIEKTSMDNPSVKQNVIQEVEKAFKATPEQEKQNIKQSINQVIDTTGNQKEINTTQQEVKQKETKESEGYFDSLLPDDLKIKPIPRKGNRFKRFKK